MSRCIARDYADAMTIVQTFSHATLVLDFDAFRLHLTVEDDPSLNVDVTSDSLAAMNDVYRAHERPYVLGLRDAFVMEGGAPLDPTSDLGAWTRRRGPWPPGTCRVRRARSSTLGVASDDT